MTRVVQNASLAHCAGPTCRPGRYVPKYRGSRQRKRTRGASGDNGALPGFSLEIAVKRVGRGLEMQLTGYCKGVYTRHLLAVAISDLAAARTAARTPPAGRCGGPDSVCQIAALLRCCVAERSLTLFDLVTRLTDLRTTEQFREVGCCLAGLQGQTSCVRPPRVSRNVVLRN